MIEKFPDDRSMLQEIIRELMDFFDGDYRKVLLWFSTKNPMLGNVAPEAMIAMGKTEKLHKFVMTARQMYDNDAID